MFITVEIEPDSSNIKDKIRDLFYPPIVEVEEIKVPNAKSFYSLRAKRYRGIIPWHTIETKANKYKNRVLISPKIKIPDDIMLACYQPKVLKSRLLFNSSVKVLQTMALDPVDVYVSIIDENAYMVDLVESLMPYVAGIKIITDCFFEYESLAKKLMQEYGISVIISSKIDDSVLSSTIIISDKSTQIPLIYSGLLFTNEKKSLLNGKALVGQDVILLDYVDKLCPKGIEKLEFSAALYELCGDDELGSLQYKKMISCWKRLTKPDYKL